MFLNLIYCKRLLLIAFSSCFAHSASAHYITKQVQHCDQQQVCHPVQRTQQSCAPQQACRQIPRTTQRCFNRQQCQTFYSNQQRCQNVQRCQGNKCWTVPNCYNVSTPHQNCFNRQVCQPSTQYTQQCETQQRCSSRVITSTECTSQPRCQMTTQQVWVPDPVPIPTPVIRPQPIVPTRPKTPTQLVVPQRTPGPRPIVVFPSQPQMPRIPLPRAPASRPVIWPKNNPNVPEIVPNQTSSPAQTIGVPAPRPTQSPSWPLPSRPGALTSPTSPVQVPLPHPAPVQIPASQAASGSGGIPIPPPRPTPLQTASYPEKAPYGGSTAGGGPLISPQQNGVGVPSSIAAPSQTTMSCAPEDMAGSRRGATCSPVAAGTTPSSPVTRQDRTSMPMMDDTGASEVPESYPDDPNPNSADYSGSIVSSNNPEPSSEPSSGLNEVSSLPPLPSDGEPNGDASADPGAGAAPQVSDSPSEVDDSNQSTSTGESEKFPDPTQQPLPDWHKDAPKPWSPPPSEIVADNPSLEGMVHPPGEFIAADDPPSSAAPASTEEDEFYDTTSKSWVKTAWHTLKNAGNSLSEKWKQFKSDFKESLIEKITDPAAKTFNNFGNGNDQENESGTGQYRGQGNDDSGNGRR